MVNKRALKFIAAIISATAIGFFLVRAFIEGRYELKKEQELDSPVKVESRVSVKNGRSVVIIGDEVADKSGVVVSALESITYQGKIYGVFIPDAAVVWSEGKSWAYIREGGASFIRYEIPTDTPIKDGWFASSNDLMAGALVVVSGAQLLLSEEFRSQIHVEEN